MKMQYRLSEIRAMYEHFYDEKMPGKLAYVKALRFLINDFGHKKIDSWLSENPATLGRI